MTTASAPSDSATRAAFGSSTSTITEMPSPSEIAWLNRLPPGRAKCEDRIAFATVLCVRARPATVLAALALFVPAADAALIHGTARPDRLKGTPRADRIDALFGGKDRVACGKGVDVVSADQADTVTSDCELVSRVISTDSLVAAAGQHQTEVEPSAAAWESTVVATFQVGRFRDGGAAGIGWSTSTNAGRTWRSGVLPS